MHNLRIHAARLPTYLFVGALCRQTGKAGGRRAGGQEGRQVGGWVVGRVNIFGGWIVDGRVFWVGGFFGWVDGWMVGWTNKLVVKRLGIMWLEKIWRRMFYVSPTAVRNSETLF